MKRVLMCAVLIAWSGMASAVVYKWVDAQGKTLYGDRPPDGVNAQVVELLGTHITRTGKPAAAAPSAPGYPAAATAAVDPTKKAVDEDVAQERQKQCIDAQERYKKLVEGRKMYKTGPNGEREYLTSEEIDTERVNAKREVDEVCNGASASTASTSGGTK